MLTKSAHGYWWTGAGVFHQSWQGALKIGNNPSEINPKGGFKHYGIIRNEYMIIEGSVPGAIKRLIRLRDAIRAKSLNVEPPQITYINIR